jgi:hypothetical protein
VKKIFKSKSNQKKELLYAFVPQKNKQVVSKGGKYVSNKKSIRLPRKVKNNRGMQTHAKSPWRIIARRSKKKKKES